MRRMIKENPRITPVVQTNDEEDNDNEITEDTEEEENHLPDSQIQPAMIPQQEPSGRIFSVPILDFSHDPWSNGMQT